MNIRKFTHINIHLFIHIDINSNIYKCIVLSIIMKIPSNKILKLIERERVVTSSEVAEAFGVSWNTAEKYLVELIIEGKVERIKKVGVNLWILK